MKLPELTGRIYKPFDIHGWIMCILGLVFLCKFGGIGWIFGTDKNWWLFAFTFFLFIEYALQVALGRIYKFVYYDTILNDMYELDVSGEQFFVCASSLDELDLYMETMHPTLEYKIVNDTLVESFVKTEHHQ